MCECSRLKKNRSCQDLEDMYISEGKMGLNPRPIPTFLLGNEVMQ